MVILRSEQEKQYKDLGLAGEALDAALKLGAAARHESRVGYLLETFPNKCLFLLYALADMVGVGGPGPWGRGEGTDRYPQFARLGKGRKQASDGGAWDAAIKGAVDRICGQLYFEQRPILDSAADRPMFLAGDESFLIDSCPECAWGNYDGALAVTGEALLHAMGKDAPRASRIPGWCCVLGNPREWAEHYNRLARDQAAAQAVEGLYGWSTQQDWWAASTRCREAGCLSNGPDAVRMWMRAEKWAEVISAAHGRALDEDGERQLALAS